MDEKIFLTENDIMVSNARFIVGGQTHAMSGITSVQMYEKKPSRIIPIILFVLGLLCLKISFALAVFVIACGVISLVITKTIYQINITSSSTRVTAYEHKDKDYIARIVKAVNDAIISRG